MNKNVKTTLVIISVAGGAFAIYELLFNSKMAYAKIISSYTGIGYKNYLSMDKGYLKARAKAFKSKSAIFTFNGGTYKTDSGKSTATPVSSSNGTLNTQQSNVDWLKNI